MVDDSITIQKVVDTPVWSLALRRKVRSENASTRELASLIEDGRVAMIGPVRQEVLPGIKEQSQLERLREHLRSFPDVLLTSEDHEEAASFRNRCRGKGIQGSNTDFLICAIAARLEYPVFTTDKDFAHFAKVLPIALHDANGKRVP